MILGLKEKVKHTNIYNVNACIIAGIYVRLKNAKNKGKYLKEVNEIVHAIERQGNMISSKRGMRMIR